MTIYLLANLNSNTHIDLSINVTLSSIITLSNLNNISIIGQNNPTISCSSAGGIRFTLCYNCTIEGITWDGCGSKNFNGSSNPVIEFYHSTNITIQHCNFKYSVARAIVLLEVSENVEVYHCRFVLNKYYKGHGTALYFKSITNFQENPQIIFTVHDCNFSKNEGSASIVYIGHQSHKYQLIILNNCIFNGNQGRALYLSNQKLYIVGNVLFENNTAEYGAGIYISDHSAIIFCKNSVVTFNHNIANNSGGAILLNNFSSIIFEANCVVIFSSNMANQSHGGCIYSYKNSNIVLRGNSSVKFRKNVTRFGGALYIEASTTLTVEENSSVIFNCNKADFGGAVYIKDNSFVLFEGNSFTAFNCSVKDLHYQALLFYGTHIFANKCMTAVFSNNRAMQGGAIYVTNKSSLHFKEISLVIFLNNVAEGNGGTISCCDHSKILFEDKSHSIFTNNKAKLGGAVYSKDNTVVLFDSNSITEFTNNIAKQNGGAMFHIKAKEVFQDNSTVKFTANTASYGGAVYYGSNSHVTLGKHSVYIITNHNDTATQGGAAYSENNTNIT